MKKEKIEEHRKTMTNRKRWSQRKQTLRAWQVPASGSSAQAQRAQPPRRAERDAPGSSHAAIVRRPAIQTTLEMSRPMKERKGHAR